MPFPRTRDELETAGYHFDAPGQCRGPTCHADLEWWWTPTGRRIPLNVDGSPHWQTCYDAAQFRTPR